MCGIAGVVRRDGSPVDPDTIRAMNRALRHRGPDGEGEWIEGAVGLGNRRLAIIDPAGGQQPMSNEDGSLWLTFNGEIYNFRELQHTLRQQGHRFRTASDSEVILHAYEQWGHDCVRHLRGMFAFGIVDRIRRELFLARDHFGIKPLYVSYSKRGIAFASEIQALLVLPDADLTLDLRAIDQYLRLGYIPAPRTAYCRVRKIPPSHRLTVSLSEESGPPERYWQAELPSVRARDEGELEEELDAVLRESVRSHLVADVPYGAFLSGGVDSSAIVSYMVEALGKTFPVFTIGFEEGDFSEVSFAKAAAQRWGLEHHVEVVRPDALEILPLLVRHYGEPFADSSAIPTYYLSRLARGRVPMVLSGDGGDEFFLGYENYARWLWWLSFDGSSPVKNRIRPLARRVWPQRFPAREPSLESWLDFVSIMPTPLRRALWREEYRSITRLEVESFHASYETVASQPPAAKAAHLDRLTYLPDDILSKVDVASMANGLEVRTPLVDLKVAAFAAALPEHVNMRRCRDRRWEGKLLLKRLLGRYLPEEHVRRPKKGFSIPIDDWFRSGTRLHRVLDDRISDPRSSLHQLFDKEAMRAIAVGSRGSRSWQLLVLDEWFRENPRWTLPPGPSDVANEP